MSILQNILNILSTYKMFNVSRKSVKGSSILIICLVNAPNDPTMSKIANEQCFPALDMLVPSTWLKERLP